MPGKLDRNSLQKKKFDKPFTEFSSLLILSLVFIPGEALDLIWREQPVLVTQNFFYVWQVRRTSLQPKHTITKYTKSLVIADQAVYFRN